MLETYSNPTPKVGWSFLLRKNWLGYFVMLIVFSVACVWLGNWQFERRAQAQAEIMRIDTNYDAQPVPLSDALSHLDDFDVDLHKWKPVEIRGHYVGEPLLARNRPGVGGVGSNLIQAFETAEGAVLFIDRGWVGVSGTDTSPSDLPVAADGEVTVQARLRAAEPLIPGRTPAGNSVASINPSEMASVSHISQNYYSAAYGQLISELPESATGALSARPERDEGPHLSYALQWYVFIIIAIVGVMYAARQEYRGMNAEDQSVLREDLRRAERKRKRGPTDADEEDAILDQ